MWWIPPYAREGALADGAFMMHLQAEKRIPQVRVFHTSHFESTLESS